MRAVSHATRINGNDTRAGIKVTYTDATSERVSVQEFIERYGSAALVNVNVTDPFG
jgi:hypothetical protein